ncbi:MAG: cobalamin biosynthesis protein [Lachnospiraceae bacterium]
MEKSYKDLKVSIISFTKYGAALSLELRNILVEHGCNITVYTAKSSIQYKDIKNINCTLREWTGLHFKTDDIIIFTGACGIAVRSIAPFIKDKRSDPAVIVIDDMGINVIPLLSGHIGGANKWARLIALKLNANPVITTSSDIHNKIAIDLLAENNNLYIGNMEAARKIQAAVIEGLPVAVFCNAGIKGNIPDNFYIKKIPVNNNNIIKNIYNNINCGNTSYNNINSNNNCNNTNHSNTSYRSNNFNNTNYNVNGYNNYSCYNYNIVISPFNSFKNSGVFNDERSITLHLIPKVITVGVGCRRSKTYSEINSFASKVLEAADISLHAVSEIATIDIKKDEAGILEFADRNKWPVLFYNATQLESVTEDISFSGFVKEVTGTGNVCERAALFPQGEKKLVLEKQAGNGITVAAAIKKWSVDFG